MVFGLFSASVPATSITTTLGVQPDEIMLVRGRRRSDPVGHIAHGWKIRCDTPGLTLDEQVARVMQRLRPVAEQIRSLVGTEDIDAVLRIVREFEAEDGAEGLMGWQLDAATLALLVSMGVRVDCQEYAD